MTIIRHTRLCPSFSLHADPYLYLSEVQAQELLLSMSTTGVSVMSKFVDLVCSKFEVMFVPTAPPEAWAQLFCRVCMHGPPWAEGVFADDAHASEQDPDLWISTPGADCAQLSSAACTTILIHPESTFRIPNSVYHGRCRYVDIQYIAISASRTLTSPVPWDGNCIKFVKQKLYQERQSVFLHLMGPLHVGRDDPMVAASIT
jgi:hypothetical protein